uniref:Uncharacterized protein n=1 Tax=Anguilla anguilla TaxID=7936 RepID=A0A0E9RJY1_ANGAN
MFNGFHIVILSIMRLSKFSFNERSIWP